jgi:hypothetical protein
VYSTFWPSIGWRKALSPLKQLRVHTYLSPHLVKGTPFMFSARQSSHSPLFHSSSGRSQTQCARQSTQTSLPLLTGDGGLNRAGGERLSSLSSGNMQPPLRSLFITSPRTRILPRKLSLRSIPSIRFVAMVHTVPKASTSLWPSSSIQLILPTAQGSLSPDREMLCQRRIRQCGLLFDFRSP